MSTSVKRSEKQLPSKEIFSINGKPFIYLFTYLFFYLLIYLYTPESLAKILLPKSTFFFWLKTTGKFGRPIYLGAFLPHQG